MNTTFKSSTTVVISDIFGTFSNSKDTDRSKDLLEFVNNLQLLMNKNNCDKLVLNFITNDTYETLYHFTNEVKPFLESNQYLGIHSTDKQQIMGNVFTPDYSYREQKILKTIKILSVEYDIKRVYYLDDSAINIAIIKAYLDRFLNIPVTYIHNIKRNGLSSLNIQISNYLNDDKKLIL